MGEIIDPTEEETTRANGMVYAGLASMVDTICGRLDIGGLSVVGLVLNHCLRNLAILGPDQARAYAMAICDEIDATTPEAEAKAHAASDAAFVAMNERLEQRQADGALGGAGPPAELQMVASLRPVDKQLLEDGVIKPKAEGRMMEPLDWIQSFTAQGVAWLMKTETEGAFVLAGFIDDGGQSRISCFASQRKDVDAAVVRRLVNNAASACTQYAEVGDPNRAPPADKVN